MLGNIGKLQEAQKQYAPAFESYQQAMTIYGQIGAKGPEVDGTQRSLDRLRARIGGTPPPENPSVSPTPVPSIAPSPSPSSAPSASSGNPQRQGHR
jgi:hypothetical protein